MADAVYEINVDYKDRSSISVLINKLYYDFGFKYDRVAYDRWESEAKVINENGDVVPKLTVEVSGNKLIYTNIRGKAV